MREDREWSASGVAMEHLPTICIMRPGARSLIARANEVCV